MVLKIKLETNLSGLKIKITKVEIQCNNLNY